MRPLPSRGRIFEGSQLAGPGDVGPDGRAHLDAVARWLQDVAFADLLDADLGDTGTWVVRRTMLRIERLPQFAEQLRLQTFCSGLAKSVAERRTTISGANGARIEAEAQWVQVDPATRMPTRLSEAFRGLYEPSSEGRRAPSRLRHPAPAADAERLEWQFADADVDLAGHVNNVVYWRIAEQHLPDPEGPCEIALEYRSGTGAGTATVLRSGDLLWVLAADGSVAASIGPDLR